MSWEPKVSRDEVPFDGSDEIVFLSNEEYWELTHPITAKWQKHLLAVEEEEALTWFGSTIRAGLMDGTILNDTREWRNSLVSSEEKEDARRKMLIKLTCIPLNGYAYIIKKLVSEFGIVPEYVRTYDEFENLLNEVVYFYAEKSIIEWMSHL